jgi:NAD(P)-dependent dehydrogenase (short-subunit alcohol dehydrogenase family)
MQGRLEGKVAIVTGAGSGIGRAVCERFAEEGAEIVPTSRTRQHLRETVAVVNRISGRNPRSFVLDVRDSRLVEHVVGEVGDTYGRIDIICNNAGIELPHGPPLERVTDEEWESVFSVNVTGMFRVCRAALPFMGDGGSIVNLGSVNSFVAWPNDAPYTASKGAVLQFSRALAIDLGQRNIRVNCVCPGIIDTPLTRSFIATAADPDAVVAEYEAVSPLRRLGTAHEVANCVVFLASEEASFVTGAALLVDGGSTASG